MTSREIQEGLNPKNLERALERASNYVLKFDERTEIDAVADIANHQLNRPYIEQNRIDSIIASFRQLFLVGRKICLLLHGGIMSFE